MGKVKIKKSDVWIIKIKKNECKVDENQAKDIKGRI